MNRAYWRRVGAFALAAGERAGKTFAQTLGAMLVTDKVSSVFDADWPTYLGASSLAALLSVLFSVGSSQFGGRGPSLANETTTPVP